MQLYQFQFPPETESPFHSIFVAARTKREACSIVGAELEMPLDLESAHPLGRGRVAVNAIGQSAATSPSIVGARAR